MFAGDCEEAHNCRGLQRVRRHRSCTLTPFIAVIIVHLLYNINDTHTSFFFRLPPRKECRHLCPDRPPQGPRAPRRRRRRRRRRHQAQGPYRAWPAPVCAHAAAGEHAEPAAKAQLEQAQFPPLDQG